MALLLNGALYKCIKYFFVQNETFSDIRMNFLFLKLVLDIFCNINESTCIRKREKENKTVSDLNNLPVFDV